MLIVPFEDVIGSHAEDIEVGREVQFDRKGKRVQVDKSNNESGPEFEVGGEEPKKYLFEGTFVSKRMFDVLNFCPSFDLGIDDEPNANDIELDDMEFTKLDLKMIDECVQMRYLSTSKNEEDVDADDDYILVDDSTPDIPRKRLRKAAAVFKSPYTSNFGSNFGSSAKIREIRTGTYALPDELNDAAIEDVVDFEEWYIVGLLKKNKKKRFDDKNEILNPPFDFGVAEVANKKWFYDLRTPGKCLGDTHIDVAFYHLRKIVKYSTRLQIRLTTTDYAFDCYIRMTSQIFLNDRNVVGNHKALLSYVRGHRIGCNKPWWDVDHMLIPVLMENKAH
ncbi:uncharacterized protein Fot_02740 [Forsythia ovata]|uniref:Uncharacterized protein n=1 Tax=Forsythia ovata TaxID=205694 RepID=A0ABD1X7P9_9LAMI